MESEAAKFESETIHTVATRKDLYLLATQNLILGNSDILTSD